MFYKAFIILIALVVCSHGADKLKDPRSLKFSYKQLNSKRINTGNTTYSRGRWKDDTYAIRTIEAEVRNMSHMTSSPVLVGVIWVGKDQNGLRFTYGNETKEFPLEKGESNKVTFTSPERVRQEVAMSGYTSIRSYGRTDDGYIIAMLYNNKIVKWEATSQAIAKMVEGDEWLLKELVRKPAYHSHRD